MKLTKERFRQLLGVVFAVSVIICGVIAFFFRNHYFSSFFSRLLKLLMPFLYGGVIAYLLRPLCLKLENLLTGLVKKFSKRARNHPPKGALRMASILLSLALLFVLLGLLLLAVLPQMVTSISALAGQLPGAIERFRSWTASLDNGTYSHEVVVYVQQAVDTITERLQNFLQSDVLPSLQRLVSDVTSSFMNLLNFVKNFGLGCIISSYLLGGWEKFAAQAKMIVYGLFPPRIADWIRGEVHLTDRMFSGFIHGKLVDSLIIGILCFAFTMITGMPYALLVSIIVGITNIIPFFGPYMGAIPSLLLILTVSPAKCLIFLVFVIILQQFDGNVLGPRILGDRLGLSGIWILFAILLFGAWWGLPGMLAGVPVFAVLYDLIRKLVVRCLKRRGQTRLVDDYVARFCEPKDG